jgi:FixJ family two-component response regulator
MTEQAVSDVPRTLYLLDDNADFRGTAKWWLSGAGYEVVDFEDGPAAIAALQALSPQQLGRSCLLLDVRMPGMSGLQVHDALIACGVAGAGGALPIIYMTGHGDVPLAVQAMEKGAVTFLEKPFEDSALESALERAFAQRADAVPQPAPCPEFQRRLSGLTVRETQVMQGVVDGKISKVIARDLNISSKTVELHRGRVLAKMQADSAIHLTRMVVEQRVL